MAIKAVLFVWVPYLLICSLTLGDCHSKTEDKSLSDLEKRLDAQEEQLERCEKRSQSEIHSLKQRIEELERLVLRQGTKDQGDDREYNKQSEVEIDSTKNVDEGKTVSKTGCTDGQRNKRQENEMTVAFYARASNGVQNVGLKKSVVFDQAITNIGASYSTTNGTFTAPVSGLYVFSVWLMAYHSKTEHYTLSKNSQPVAYMFARTIDQPYMNTGQTAILQLEIGDNVEIQFWDSAGSLHGGFSTFAGFLLQKDYDTTTYVGK